MSEIKIKSAHLLSWQPECCSIFENMPKGDTLVICSQRQVGKSFTCSQILLFCAINYSDSVSIYVSPTNDSSRKFFNDIKKMVDGTVFVRKVNESLLTIEFFNGSTILFRSAESKLRGYSCRNNGILVVDEAQYVPNEIWEVILPFTNVDNSKKIIISTPRFKNSMFWEFYVRALNNENGYHLISTMDYDTSMFLSDEQKKEYQKILSPQSYRSEIMGEWLDAGDGIFGDYKSVYRNPLDKLPVIVGIDWSNNGGDNTVISGFNSKNEQCMLEIVTNVVDPVERVKKIASILNSYSTIKKIVCETNSLGEVYISVLKRKLNNPNIIVNFTTTNESKKRIVEKLISSIGEKKITLLSHPQLDYELSIYEIQSLKNGNYTYNGKKDDCIMATCFCLEYMYGNNKGHYVFGSNK